MTQPDMKSSSRTPLSWYAFCLAVVAAAWMALLGALPRLLRWMLGGWR